METGAQLIAIYHSWLFSFDKYTLSKQKLKLEGSGRRAYRSSLYYFCNLSINQKLLKNKKFYSLKNCKKDTTSFHYSLHLRQQIKLSLNYLCFSLKKSDAEFHSWQDHFSKISNLKITRKILSCKEPLEEYIYIQLPNDSREQM